MLFKLLHTASLQTANINNSPTQLHLVLLLHISNADKSVQFLLKMHTKKTPYILMYGVVQSVQVLKFRGKANLLVTDPGPHIPKNII